MSEIEQKSPQKWGRNGAESGAKVGQDFPRTKRLQKNLPAGIMISERHDGRKKPFRLRFGAPRREKWFALEIDRNDAAEKLAAAKEERGRKILDFDPEEWQEFLAFKKRVNAPLQEVERVYSQARGNSALALSAKAAVEKYRILRLGEGLAPDSTRHMKTILGRFVEFSGHLPLGATTADTIREWISALKKKHGFESTTLRHHRKEVNTFFNRAILEKWAHENPCRAVIPPKFTEKEIQFLQVQEAFQLFKANRGEKVIGKLALEAFAGLRCSTASVIPKKDLDEEAKGIVIAALKTTGKRHYVDGFPENLWAWIAFAGREECWKISQRNYDKLKGEAFIRAGIKNPGNVLRHSFATHHMAAFRDGAKTAFLLCHRSPAMLFRHYNGRGVPQKEALAYFAITPESTLLTWEKFCASINLTPPCSTPKIASASA